MRPLLLPAALSILALTACQSETPSADGDAGNATDAAAPAPPPDIAPSPDRSPAAPSPSPPSPSPPPIPTPTPTPTPTPEAPAPAEATPGPIPRAYRGIWAIETKDCAAQPGMTRIAIAPAAIRYYEGRSSVLRAAGSGARIVIDVEHEAEGTTERSRQTLSLSPDGRTLTFSRAGESFAYRKCA